MQLTYNEAFDPYHTAFRLLRLNYSCGFHEKIHFDKFRILDFYLLFPFRIKNMSLFSEDTTWRKISLSYSDLEPYGGLPDDAAIFPKMEPFQRAAITTLSKIGVLSKEAWSNNEILFEPFELPSELKGRYSELNKSMPDVITILCMMKEKYPLMGRDGLKARSGLLEYRYDSI